MKSTNQLPETFKITGDWPRQSRELKRKYTQLTDADLSLEEGDTEDLLFRVGKRLKKIRPDIIKIIKKVQKKLLRKLQAVKPITIRKSNLLHNYYAVNSVDGRNFE